MGELGRGKLFALGLVVGALLCYWLFPRATLPEAVVPGNLPLPSREDDPDELERLLPMTAPTKRSALEEEFRAKLPPGATDSPPRPNGVCAFSQLGGQLEFQLECSFPLLVLLFST